MSNVTLWVHLPTVIMVALIPRPFVKFSERIVRERWHQVLISIWRTDWPPVVHYWCYNKQITYVMHKLPVPWFRIEVYHILALCRLWFAENNCGRASPIVIMDHSNVVSGWRQCIYVKRAPTFLLSKENSQCHNRFMKWGTVGFQPLHTAQGYLKFVHNMARVSWCEWGMKEQ